MKCLKPNEVIALTRVFFFSSRFGFRHFKQGTHQESFLSIDGAAWIENVQKNVKNSRQPNKLSMILISFSIFFSFAFKVSTRLTA